MLPAIFLFILLTCEAHAAKGRRVHHKWIHPKLVTTTVVELKTIANITSISAHSHASASKAPAVTSAPSCIPNTVCYDGFTCGVRYGGCYDSNHCGTDTATPSIPTCDPTPSASSTANDRLLDKMENEIMQDAAAAREKLEA